MRTGHKVILICVALLVGGCNVVWRDNWAVDSRQAAVLAAQIRRTQLVNQIVLLERLNQRSAATETRSIIQSQINRARFEIEQLNAIIER